MKPHSTKPFKPQLIIALGRCKIFAFTLSAYLLTYDGAWVRPPFKTYAAAVHYMASELL